MQPRRIAVTANFTAEPVADSLAYLLRGFGLASELQFAPFDQVFQQLLDPSSLLGANRSGANVVMLRLDPWLRDEPRSRETGRAPCAEIEELAGVLRTACGRMAVPTVVAFCPPDPTARQNRARASAIVEAERWLAADLRDVANLQVVASDELLARHGGAEYWDAESDAIGAICYTTPFFATLGMTLARRVRAAIGAPYKVVVLDCDNTLWRGVVGEAGPLGVEVDAPLGALQRLVAAQHDAGMLVCLCSKNNEADVREVFARHPSMVLRWEQIACARINWEPKSENLRSLAAELGLGLSSFVFIDDSPYEVAEVRRHCPEVLALQLPAAPEDIERFFEHSWFFDRASITAADRLRAASYAQNVQRDGVRRRAASLDDFLRELDLRVEVRAPASEELERAAQMTQRTNQFNLSTIRRTAAELNVLITSGALQARIVDVRDRFGDYGIVGLLLFATNGDTLRVDTFLLSCRALGRRVEHRMLAHLGEAARASGLSAIELPFVRSRKNAPALQFLERVTGDSPGDRSEQVFAVSPEAACAAPSLPVAESPEALDEQEAESTSGEPSASDAVVDVELVSRLYTELHDPERLAEAARASRPVEQRSASRSLVAPRTEMEATLLSIWKRVLHDDEIGVTDDFFDLGGNSLAAVPMFAQLRRRFGTSLGPTTLLEAPTIAELALRLSTGARAAPARTHTSLLPIQRGGTRTPLFLVHAGAGTVFIYHQLAMALGPDQPVYGLQAQGLYGADRPHATIEAMAEHYVREIRSVQPSGPYRLAGFCLGATIALEMALQLERAGEEVAFLGSFDGPAPGYRGGARQSSVAAEASGRLRIRMTRRVYQWRNRLLRRYMDRTDAPVPGLFRRASWYFTVNNMFAKHRYAPKETFRGRMHVFTIAGRYADPTIGWSRWATGGVVPYLVTGEFRLHRDLMRPPMVRQVAERLAPLLDGTEVASRVYPEPVRRAAER